MSDNGLSEPLAPATAKRLILAALAGGGIEFSGHAIDEMQNDSISQDEALAVLRGGSPEPGEFERGSWRYRVRRSRAIVVVAFRAQDCAVVVTAWRLKR